MRAAFNGGDTGCGIGQEHVLRDGGVGELMNERAVGTIFEQAAYKIGQQFAVATHWRIGTAGKALFPHQALVQSLPHAVQALEFEIPAVAGPIDQGGDGQGVVTRKGRIDMRGIEHVARTGQIRDICRGLAGEERIIAHAVDLGLLDLGIPIGAFNQPDHQPVTGGGAERLRPAHQRATALAIGLDGHAEAFPAGKLGIARHAFDDVERHHQALGFLGVHRQADTAVGRLTRQLAHHFSQFGHAPVGIGDFIARMQGRQLDRDIMSQNLRCADGGDGIFIGFKIARGIVDGAGGFTQHVETGGEPLILRFGGAIERFIDIAAHDENRTHQAHGGGNTGANERFAGAGQQPLQDAVIIRDQSARHDQAEGGGIDQFRLGLARMGLPIGIAQLITYQQISRRRIRYAQIRLGQRQQRHPFQRIQAVFLEKTIDPAGRLRPAQVIEDQARLIDNPATRGGIKGRCGQQGFQDIGFGCPQQGVHL